MVPVWSGIRRRGWQRATIGDMGETFSTGRGHEWRVLAIDTNIDDELVERGINAVFTVEPA